MATNDKRIRLYNRKFTSITSLDTYFYESLNKGVRDILTRSYPPGVFKGGGVISSSQVNSISVSATEAVNYYGYKVDILAQSNITFENTAATTYYVGIKAIEIEAGDPTANAVEVNSQTGISEYVYWQEQIGELGNPDTIYNNGDGTLTIVVDSVTESGHSYAGRTVRVWLTALLSTGSGWYEDLTVQYGTGGGLWVGNKNYIVTSGNLHQLSVKGFISTVTTSYRVWMKGITITTTDISSNNNYIFLGTVLGNGATPNTFDQSGMSVIENFGNITDNIIQLSKDIYGETYTFNNDGNRSKRLIGEFTDGDVTPDISNYHVYSTNNSAPTTITGLDSGIAGDERIILARDSNTTLKHGVFLALENGLDYTMSPFDNITLKCISSSSWREIYRSENGYIGTTTSTTTSTSSSTSSSISTSSSTSTLPRFWMISNNLNTGRHSLGGCGNQSAGLSFGGTIGTNSAISEEYDGISWSGANNLNTARRGLSGCGSQINGLSFGGYDTTYSVITEKYNGTVWTSTGNLNTARIYLAGCGIQSAALSFGGYNGSYVNTTEEFNGSVWSGGGNLNTARRRLSGCGTQSAGLSFGGNETGDVTSGKTEEYNGTLWALSNDLNVSRYYLAGCGTQLFAVSFGGSSGAGIFKNETEEYDGTSWSNGGDLNTARHSLGGCGIQIAALSFGGRSSIDTYSQRTEEYGN